MATTLRLGLAAVCLATGTSAWGADAPNPLRWKFKAGDAFRYEFRQKNASRSKVNGNDLVNLSELALDLSWKVKGVAADGSAEIVQRVEHAVAKVKTGGQEVEYDSNDPVVPSDPVGLSLHGVYKPAVTEEYVLKLDPRGRVIDVQVPEKVTEALRASPYLASADGGSIFSPTGVKNLLSQVLPTLPEKLPAKGDVWTGTLDLPVPQFKMVLTSKYTLGDVAATSSKIDAKLSIAMTPVGEVPFSIEVQKTSSGTGAFTLDTAKGRLVDSKVRHNFDLVIKAKDKEVPQASVIDVSLTLKP